MVVLSLCCRAFARLGGHQLVELGVLGEFICERYKGAADLNQAVSCVNKADVQAPLCRWKPD